MLSISESGALKDKEESELTEQMYPCVFKNSKPWLYLNWSVSALMSTISHEKESQGINSITDLIQQRQTSKGVYLLVCAAPDRVAHCNSPLQVPFPKEISISQICLINQDVKNRKLWDNHYAHRCWAFKSSIKFLSTFFCLYCRVKWIKQAKNCGNRDGAFVQ